METLTIAGSIAALAVSLITIAGIAVSLGKRDARLDALEERVKEDREKNMEQHKDFYAVRDMVTGVTVEFREFGRRLEKIETSLEEILSRLPAKQ